MSVEASSVQSAQRELFPPAQAHSPTSQEAAESIKPQSATFRAQVYAWLLERGHEGGTDQEIQAALDMPENTQRPRRIELLRDGRVIDSGRVRKTRSGRNAVVWVAVEASSNV